MAEERDLLSGKIHQMRELLDSRGLIVTRTVPSTVSEITGDALSDEAIKASNSIGLHPEGYLGRPGGIISFELKGSWPGTGPVATGLYDEHGKLIGAWAVEERDSTVALSLDYDGLLIEN